MEENEGKNVYQCMHCSNKVEASELPEECPKCKSMLSFAKISDWRFF